MFKDSTRVYKRTALKIIFFTALITFAEPISSPPHWIPRPSYWTILKLFAGTGAASLVFGSFFFRFIKENVFTPKNFTLMHMQARVYKLGSKLLPEVKTKLLNAIHEARFTSNEMDIADLKLFVTTALKYPWGLLKSPQRNLDQVQQTLDEKIFGMREAKELVLDALFAHNIGLATKFPPICLLGPPGVGKTAFATALAGTLGLPSLVISAAGMDDPDTFFRGFSRTYKSSLPGFFVTSFSMCECVNPVIVIDEIDKEAKGNSKGTVQNVLLQILDPVQNKIFRDRFLDLPLDVGNAFYIVTANDLKNVIEPLQDRMIIIHIPNYSQRELLTMAHGIIWESITGARGIPRPIKEVIIQETLEETENNKELSVRTLKKNIAKKVIRWLRLNHTYKKWK